MSWTNFERMLDRAPALRPEAHRVFDAMRELPAGPGIDPLVLARAAGVDEVSTLAALGLLIQANLGRFAVQVVNDRGQSVGEFDSIDATPEVVTDAYGEELEVEPRRMRIVFRPAAELMAP